MAASGERALRFSSDSGDSEQRPQRKSAWKVIQRIDVVQKKSGEGTQNWKGGRVQKVIQRSDERNGEGLDDRVSDGIGRRLSDGIDGRVGEGIDGRVGEGIDDGEMKSGVEYEVETGRQQEKVIDEAIRCLCACKVESGEMVCCDVCEGWSHLRCIGMKEGVGVMEGKEFVCHFCVSACLLAMRTEVQG